MLFRHSSSIQNNCHSKRESLQHYSPDRDTLIKFSTLPISTDVDWCNLDTIDKRFVTRILHLFLCIISKTKDTLYVENTCFVRVCFCFIHETGKSYLDPTNVCITALRRISYDIVLRE